MITPKCRLLQNFINKIAELRAGYANELRCVGKMLKTASVDKTSRDNFEEELLQTRHAVDTVSRQLTSLTLDVATLSTDVRYIIAVLNSRCLATSSGDVRPALSGKPILKSYRRAHRVEFATSSSSASLDQQLMPTRRRRRSVDYNQPPPTAN